eukprot:COSAG06_NODE_1748_length_8478_cov_16.692923_8_plen_62_part_00
MIVFGFVVDIAGRAHPHDGGPQEPLRARGRGPSGSADLNLRDEKGRGEAFSARADEAAGNR